MSLLEAREVTKEYGPVVALRSANLSIEAGEVHALLGANGAGKSTFVKILTGVIESDSGSVELRGQPVRVSSPSQAALSESPSVRRLLAPSAVASGPIPLGAPASRGPPSARKSTPFFSAASIAPSPMR